MDKQGWQILLALKVFPFLAGALLLVFPGWRPEDFLRLTLSGYYMGLVVVLGLGLFSLVSNLWSVLKNRGEWQSIYRPGPEHALVFVYIISFSLVFFDIWIFLIPYFLTVLLVLFIIGGELGAELQEKDGRNRD